MQSATAPDVSADTAPAAAGTPGELSAHAKAVEAVQRHARDDADAELLLSMLGLLRRCAEKDCRKPMWSAHHGNPPAGFVRFAARGLCLGCYREHRKAMPDMPTGPGQTACEGCGGATAPRRTVCSRCRTMVPAEPSRQHLLALHATPLGWRKIAELSGVSDSTLRGIAIGLGGLPPTATVEIRAEGRILAVPLDAACAEQSKAA